MNYQLLLELFECRGEIHPAQVEGDVLDDSTLKHIQNHPCNKELLLFDTSPSKKQKIGENGMASITNLVNEILNKSSYAFKFKLI